MNELFSNLEEGNYQGDPSGAFADEHFLEQAPQPSREFRCADCNTRIPSSTEHMTYGLHSGVSIAFPDLCSVHADIRLREAEVALSAKEGDEILANLDGWLTGELRACGLSPKLLEARLDMVPAAYQDALDPKILDGIRDGRLPVTGIAFVGDNATGKSMTLSAFLWVLLRANAMRKARIKGSRLNFKGVKWIQWSDTVNLWRLEGTKIDWDARNKFVHQCMDAKLLILDDLAREGKSGKNTYMDDPACRLLDLILSTREAKNVPTWWTSNLTSVDLLTQVYGAATVRRLIGPNPIIHVKGVTPFSTRNSRP